MSPITLLWVSFVALTWAVDRSNFKTCDQSGFCKRQRNMQPGASPYVVLMDQLSMDNNKVTVPLLNTKNSIRLKLEMWALKGNMARLRLDEMFPDKERYEPPVGDVLIGEPEQQSLNKLQEDAIKVVFGFGDNKLVLQRKPFQIDLLVDDIPVISVNSRGLMKFEHYRSKNQGRAKGEADKEADRQGVFGSVMSWLSKPFRGEAEAGGEEAAAEGGEGQNEDDQQNEEGEQAPKEESDQNKEDDEPGMWEETFKSHKDTKPHGPSSVGLDVSFPGFDHVYGIPEHADTLALKTTGNGDPYRLFNLDVFEYELYNPMALYGSVPVMLAHNGDRTVGMFWLNAAETWVDIHSNKADKSTFYKLVEFVKGDQDIPQIDTHWMSESGVADIFLMLGPKPADVFQQYALLTGTTPLPPLFAIAYHQSRWNYNDEKDVAQVNENFDVHDIPLDVIWLDIEHTDGKRYFKWDVDRFPSSVDMLNNVSARGRKMVGSVDPHLKRDPHYSHYAQAKQGNLFVKDSQDNDYFTWDIQKFPNSAEMIKNVSAFGRKMVTIVDPHIKRDSNYHVHKEAQGQGIYIQNKDGSEYDGWCWPGSSSWLDFVDPKVRAFWAQKFLTSEYQGSTHDLFTWNDMNEPSVFNGPEVTMHKDAKHYGGWEHRDVHNIYGMYVHRATVEGQLLRDPQQRPFVLSRAFYAGSQRYGAVWTGDNTGEWGHLKISIPMVLSLNLVGITLSGADIGGFFKNPENELLTRWYQAAVFQPFFRAHAHLDTRRREPWLLPDEHHKAIREAIRLRYRLLPYWYTLFYESETSGMPIMRPLWVEFPKVKETFTVDDEHMLGSALLVHPVTDAGATGVHAFLPGADEVWYDLDTNTKYNGGQMAYVAVDLNKIPVFRRGGHIIPQRERIRRSSGLTYQDPFTLYVALDKQGRAKGNLYMDDYNSFQYKTGSYVYRSYTFTSNQLTSKNLNPDGQYTTPAWIERISVIGLSSPPSVIEISGPEIPLTQLEFKYEPKTHTLVIRKPGVGVNKDFTISLK